MCSWTYLHYMSRRAAVATKCRITGNGRFVEVNSVSPNVQWATKPMACRDFLTLMQVVLKVTRTVRLCNL